MFVSRRARRRRRSPDRRRSSCRQTPAPGSWSLGWVKRLPTCWTLRVDIPVGVSAEPLCRRSRSPRTGTSARSAGGCRRECRSVVAPAIGSAIVESNLELSKLPASDRSRPGSGCTDELRLDARRVRLGHVEHEARRAAAGVDRDLQVLDVGVEGGGVEGDAALRIFDAGFVVPQRLVVVGRRLRTAVDRLVGTPCRAGC